MYAVLLGGVVTAIWSRTRTATATVAVFVIPARLYVTVTDLVPCAMVSGENVQSSVTSAVVSSAKVAVTTMPDGSKFSPMKYVVLFGCFVTATPLVIIRSTSYSRAPPTCTTSDTFSPSRVAVTVQRPTFGSSNSVDPVPSRVVAPSEQVTAAPAQVVTLMAGLCTPMASFRYCRVARLCCPVATS